MLYKKIIIIAIFYILGVIILVIEIVPAIDVMLIAKVVPAIVVLTVGFVPAKVLFVNIKTN